MQYASSRVGVSVPATSANLGPGFDSMGLGLAVRDEMTFEALASGGTSIEIEGEGAQTLPRDERHLVVQALRRTQEYLGLPLTGLKLVAHNRIPQSRGMGSSASAIVAGVSAAVAFSGRTDLGKDFIFNVAAQMEGHPDNVAPAVFGGLTVSWTFDPETDIPAPITGERGQGLSVFDGYERGFHTCRYQVDGSIHPYLFIPTATLSTETARTVLPEKVPYANAVRNIARAALLPAVVAHGPNDTANAELFSATQDTLHQDYRKDLMPDSWQLMTQLRSAGFAATISGAGPCVLVLHSGDAENDLRQMAASEWLATGRWKLVATQVDTDGVIISKEGEA